MLMRRREFIAGLGSAAMWSLAVRAQQRERVRRIGVLQILAADDPDGMAETAAFLQGLAQLGWTDGGNVRIEYRHGLGNSDNVRKYAAELAALTPDVILSIGGVSQVGPLLQATRTVPIVFTYAADPVGGGLVDSLARPGGNATGFLAFEYSISGKWLELLKELAPSMTRVAVLRDSNIPTGPGQFGVIQAMAPSLRVEVNPVNVRDVGEIERAIMSFARSANGGLIVTGSALALVQLDHVRELAVKGPRRKITILGRGTDG